MTDIESRGANETLQIMERFQVVMDRFLDTQRDVMMAFLSTTTPTIDGKTPDSGSLSIPRTPSAHQTSDPSVNGSGLTDNPGSHDGSEFLRTWQAPEEGSTQVLTPQPEVMPVQNNPRLAEPQADITAALLEVVEARTGYPKEMLDLDHHMEADLGMDSIKRVEIIGALQRKLSPNSPLDGELTEQALRATNLRALVEAFAARPWSNGGPSDRLESDQEGDRGVRALRP